MPQDIALYIHIPFCRHKCPYCSFVSYDCREADIPLYIDALRNELTRRSGGELLSSIYFGGGTPSLLSIQQVGVIMEAVNSLFTVDKEAEITLEANPGTVTREYLAGIRELGVNRLSLGVQSMNERETAFLGRIHTVAEAREAVGYARNAGFDNLNIDLMYGLPGQTLADWRYTLEEAVKLSPEHFSLYSLTLEADTPMGKSLEEGCLQPLDPDTAAEQYELAECLLASRGYSHYEISNWAMEGRESRHNLAYWRNLPYIGAGVAAHSCLGGRRFANTKNLDKYIAGYSGETSPALEMSEEISRELEIAETVILGLRLCAGICLSEIRRRFNIDIMVYYKRQIEEMIDAGLLEKADGHIRLTARGRLLGNEVFWRFLPQ